MKRYFVSKDAEKDLDEIFVYWAERAGLEVADRLVDRITNRFWLVGEHPEAGRPCQDIEPEMRCFPAGKYLIYYRKTRRGVKIVHIYHGSRVQKKAWKREKREARQ